MNAQNPIVWFEIYVDDLKRAQKFYETILLVNLEALPSPNTVEDIQMVAFPMEMGGEGAAGALVKMDGVKSGGNSTLVYFRSEDCANEEQRIEDAGGKIFKPKQSLGEYGFMVLAFDTEGNKFGIHSLK